MSDKELIKKIQEGNQKAFEKVYDRYKLPFLSLMRGKYEADLNEALDLLQETCAALYTNIVAGKLTPESLQGATLKTYILNTGKYILFNKRRKKSVPLVFATDWILNMDDDEKIDNDVLKDTSDVEREREKQDKLFIIRESVKLMPSPCKEILTMQFYKKMKMAEIAEQLGDGKTEAAVKMQANRCKGKLSEVVKRRFNECGYDQ